MDTPISLLHAICLENSTKADYTLLSQEGKVHLPTFTYRVQVNEFTEEGSGQSKKKAKHLAAKKMLITLIDSSLMIKDDFKKNIEIFKNSDDADNECENMLDDNVSINSSVLENSSNDLSNPIGKLQEICMKKYWNPPIYKEDDLTGPPHERQFQFQCIIDNMNLVVKGIGKSKKSAKRDSAEKMLRLLQNEHLDHPDEILDRIPKNAMFNDDKKQGKVNLRNEIISFQSNKEKDKPPITNIFFKEILSNSEIQEKIYNLVPEPLKIMENFNADIEDNVEEWLSNISNLINCRCELVLHPEKSQQEQYQYWGELISTMEPYKDVVLMASWGANNCKEKARKQALKNLLFLILCFMSRE